MATTAMNLSVPALADDSMQMSSPGQHNLDEDIDFDDYQPDAGTAHMNEDDRMMDDGEQTRPGTATDDVMEDDVQNAEQTLVQEEVMEDSPSHEEHVEDEELIDYSDDEIQDEFVGDAGVADKVEQPVEAAPIVDSHEEKVDEEIIRLPSDTAFDQPGDESVEATAVLEEAAAPLPTGEEIAAPQEGVDEYGNFGEGGDHLEQAHVEQYGEDVEGHAQDYDETGLEQQLATDDSEAHKPTISLDTSNQLPAEGPATPTDTGLHPMTVRFGDLHFPLFKSKNQPDGLLKNDNLASLSLGELIQNCRQRLGIKTGETLSEDQDLVLGFGQLGLILIEDSRAAFDCSLDEVLDVYLQLHRNDETEDIPPFLLNLSLQLKFTSSISVLKQAAAGGEGMSSFGFDHSGQEEQVGEYDQYAEGAYGGGGEEEYDEQYHADETAGGREHEHEHAAHVEGSIPEQEEADTNYYGEHQEHQAEYNEPQDYYKENDEYHEEFDEGQHYEENHDEATQLLDDHTLEGEGQPEDPADAVHSAPNDEALTARSAKPSFETCAGEEKTASTATSTTLQGDEAQDTTGEYAEEDLIDWDDDSDLTSNPSDHAAADYGDFSSLLEEVDDERHYSESNLVGQQDAPEVPEHGVSYIAEDAAGQQAIESAHDEVIPHNLGSEDYLGDLQQYGEDHVDYEAGPHAEVAGEHEAYEGNENAEQQEDFNHPDYQPGEDDQFQTAYELFDEADSEQDGAEQEAPGNDADKTLVASTTNGGQHGDDDFIDFDLDEEATVGDSSVKKAENAAAGSHTPVAKRSFEDLAGDEIDFDSPEPKKARAS